MYGYIRIIGLYSWAVQNSLVGLLPMRRVFRETFDDGPEVIPAHL
jgi:hypothetical protein